ncbi:MAG: VOC family protein [Eubacteriales bacterium]|nr:VOC family protein [Eubacteriales bacterium]
MKLNWVTLKVSDLEKSMRFYTELLPLQVATKIGTDDHQIVFLGKDDSAKVELIYEKGGNVENAGKGVSVGLECDNLDQLVDKLKVNNLNVTGPISPNAHIRFFFVQDSD